ncbi:MAG: hypothetical protein QM686_03680 [Herbaspirillum sp.]
MRYRLYANPVGFLIGQHGRHAEVRALLQILAQGDQEVITDKVSRVGMVVARLYAKH